MACPMLAADRTLKYKLSCLVLHFSAACTPAVFVSGSSAVVEGWGPGHSAPVAGTAAPSRKNINTSGKSISPGNEKAGRARACQHCDSEGYDAGTARLCFVTAHWPVGANPTSGLDHQVDRSAKIGSRGMPTVVVWLRTRRSRSAVQFACAWSNRARASRMGAPAIHSFSAASSSF